MENGEGQVYLAAVAQATRRLRGLPVGRNVGDRLLTCRALLSQKEDDPEWGKLTERVKTTSSGVAWRQF